MVQSIHKTVTAGEKTCSEADREKYFEAFWPTELEPKITQLRAQDTTPRPQTDPVTEIPGLVRQIGERVARDSWRQDKTLAMLHQIYRAILGGPTPSLQELKEMQSSRPPDDCEGRLRNRRPEASRTLPLGGAH
jgi:hypothetical protein